MTTPDKEVISAEMPDRGRLQLFVVPKICNSKIILYLSWRGRPD
jgi:hypothetical protein